MGPQDVHDTMVGKIASKVEVFKEECFIRRSVIEDLKKDVKALMKLVEIATDDAEAVGEARANVMLAYRHLEDARMRLGKVVQALDGGTSCYPQ